MGIVIPTSVNSEGADRFGTGGAAPSVTPWTRLTPTLCSDHYSSGASDDYGGTSPLQLSDDGTNTKIKVVTQFNTGSYQAVIHRRFTVWWWDSGIDASTVNSVETMITHVGYDGGPHFASRQAGNGIMIGTSYLIPSRDTNPINPDHFMSFVTYHSSPNIFACAMADEETMAGSGRTYIANAKTRGNVPIYRMDAGQFRGRDMTHRRLSDVNGVNAANVRDNSTWIGAGKYWEAGQTIKIGIISCAKAANKVWEVDDGLLSQYHVKINQGKI
tara:strand:- start:284 stop:1099 length:816 start_codon:yes stop_codon:yes gene_type:complete